jgi:hypothetical protein
MPRQRHIAHATFRSYQEELSDLWKVQQLPLDQIMEKMESQYSFKARLGAL